MRDQSFQTQFPDILLPWLARMSHYRAIATAYLPSERDITQFVASERRSSAGAGIEQICG